MNFIAFSTHTSGLRNWHECCVVSTNDNRIVTKYMPEPSTGTVRVFQEQDTYFYNNINNPNISSEDLSAFPEHWELNGVTAEQVKPVSDLKFPSLRYQSLLPIVLRNYARSQVPCPACRTQGSKAENCAQLLAKEILRISAEKDFKKLVIQ